MKSTLRWKKFTFGEYRLHLDMIVNGNPINQTIAEIASHKNRWYVNSLFYLAYHPNLMGPFTTLKAAKKAVGTLLKPLFTTL